MHGVCRVSEGQSPIPPPGGEEPEVSPVFRFNNQEGEFEELRLDPRMPLFRLLNPHSCLLFIDEAHFRAWLWQGRDCSTRTKYIAAKKAPNVRDRFGPWLRITMVDVGDEPLAFKILVGLEGLNLVGVIGPKESVVELMQLFANRAGDSSYHVLEVDFEEQCVNGSIRDIDGVTTIHVNFADKSTGRTFHLCEGFSGAPKLLGVFDLAQALDAQFAWFRTIPPGFPLPIILTRYAMLAGKDKAQADATVEEYQTKIQHFFHKQGVGVTAFYLACPGAGGEFLKFNETIVNLILDIATRPPLALRLDRKILPTKIRNLKEKTYVVIPQEIPVTGEPSTIKSGLWARKTLPGSYAYKVMLEDQTGGQGSTLLEPFVEGKFDTDYKSTIGTSIMKKELCIPGTDAKVRFIIWDLAMPTEFKRVRQTYFQNAEAGIVIFDVTRRETFKTVEKCITDARRGSGKPGLPVILVGTNASEPGREVSHEEAASLGEVLGLHYVESAGAPRDWVNDIFEWLARILVQRAPSSPSST